MKMDKLLVLWEGTYRLRKVLMKYVSRSHPSLFKILTFTPYRNEILVFCEGRQNNEDASTDYKPIRSTLICFGIIMQQLLIMLRFIWS